MNLYRARKIVLGILLFVSFSTKMISQLPDTTCADADIFCDSASLYGPWTLPDSTYNENYNLCNDAVTGQPNNILFFAFVATGTEVKIRITPDFIAPHFVGAPDSGFQYGIVDQCLFKKSDETIVDYLDCSGEANTSSVIIQSTNFLPGHTYYLYVDGYQTSDVTFHLEVLKGIGDLVVDKVNAFNVFPEHGVYNVGDTVTVCQDGTFVVEALGINNAASYIWYSQDTLERSDSSKLVFKFENLDSIYKIGVQGYSDCAISDTGFIYFKVEELDVEYLPDTSACGKDLTVGITPGNWKGGPIVLSTERDTFRFSVEDSIGCHYWQQIIVNRIEEHITALDTSLCNIDTMFFNGDTIVNDLMDQYTYTSYEGCDSFVNQSFYFFHYEGEILDLECLNDNSFMLSINSTLYNSSDYDSARVTWYLNDNILSEGNSFDLLSVNKTGRYSAEVTLYKKGNECSFDLNEIVVNQLPSAKFTMSRETICSSDSVIIDIYQYIDTLSYTVTSPTGIIRKISNSKYSIHWISEGEYEIKVTSSYKGCDLEYTKNITVEPEIIKPIINCVESTNSSVIFDWVLSGDCVNEYEIWIDGVLKNTISTGPYTISNLAYGQQVDIVVKTHSLCVCTDKSDTTVCTALPCPNRQIEINNLPDQICFDELSDTINLGFTADTSGTELWTGGEFISSSGKIFKSKLDAGLHIVSLEYTIGDCVYKRDSSFMVFPELEMDFNVTDISCYDYQDGGIEIIPVQGTPEYLLQIDGETKDSLIVNGLDAGDYSFIITDHNGCTYQDNFSIIRPDKPFVEIIGLTTVKFNTEFKYYLDSDINDPDSVYWYINDSLVCTDACDTISIIPDNDFTICAVMFFDDQCDIDTCLDVRIDRNFDIYVPNIFSPNFDGINDNFSPSTTNGLSVKIKTFRIFDRWGELLFFKENFLIGTENGFGGWNGLFNGKVVSAGVYVYYIEIEADNGDITKKYGDITVIH